MSKESVEAFKNELVQNLSSAWQRTVPAYDLMAMQLMAECEKTMSGLKFTNFTAGQIESMVGGVRLHFRATRADGQTADYTVDFKYDDAKNFRCDRAFLSFRANTALSEQEQ